MLNDHSKVGIATTAFYVPAVVLSAYLLFCRHRRPRMAWYFLFMFSLVRVASGIVVILYENKPKNVGLLIATIIVLGVGVMPLIAVTIGMLRIIHAKDFDDDHLQLRAVILSRALFLLGVVLLIIGGVYVGQYKNASSVSLGTKLVRAGYIVVVVLLAYLVGFQSFLWTRKGYLSQSSKTVLKGVNVAMPFLAIRIAYAMLSVFEPADVKWNNLSGLIGNFITMCLLMEYAAMIVFIGVGLLVPPIESNKVRNAHDRTSVKPQRELSHTEETLVQKLHRKWDERD